MTERLKSISLISMFLISSVGASHKDPFALLLVLFRLWLPCSQQWHTTNNKHSGGQKINTSIVFSILLKVSALLCCLHIRLNDRNMDLVSTTGLSSGQTHTGLQKMTEDLCSKVLSFLLFPFGSWLAAPAAAPAEWPNKLVLVSSESQLMAFLITTVHWISSLWLSLCVYMLFRPLK